MSGRYDIVVCLDDLLRSDFWPAREFIYDLVRMPVFGAAGLDIAKGPRNGQRNNLLPGFELDRFIALAGDSWVKLFHAVPEAAAQYLRRHLPPNALVLSYEMPPWLQKVLDAHGCDWIDVRMSPLRFASDLIVGLRTNSPRLYAAAHAFSLPVHQVAGEAALLAAKLRYPLRYQPVTGAMDEQCVYIGQTESDASLLRDDGRFVRAIDYADTLKKLAAAGPLHYKPHPMGGEFAKQEVLALERITHKKVLLCETDTYELLAREDKIILVGLSSGVLQEAAWFGREAYALFRPICETRFDAAHDSAGCLQIASHQFMSQPLWSALLGSTGAQPPLVMPPRANHLRELHNTWWGYATAMLRNSAFEREANVLAGTTRQAEALRRCEAELAATKAEVKALKELIGKAPAAPVSAVRTAVTTAAPAPAAATRVTDARIDTLRMEVEGLKEALRVVMRQNAPQPERRAETAGV